MPKKFLTVREVAGILGVTPLTVRNWDQKGRLVAYRNPLNNYRLYKISDVENLLKKIEQSQGKTFSPSPKPEPEKPKFRKLEIEIE